MFEFRERAALLVNSLCQSWMHFEAHIHGSQDFCFQEAKITVPGPARADSGSFSGTQCLKEALMSEVTRS